MNHNMNVPKCSRQITLVVPQSYTLIYMNGWYGGTVNKIKFSRTDGLPYVLTSGAPRTRLAH